MDKYFSAIFHSILIIFSLIVMIYFARNQQFDHYSYLLYYEKISYLNSFNESINSSRFEPGFAFLSYYLSRLIESPTIHFFFVASIVVLIKYKLFVKYLYSPILAWLFYLAVFIPAFESNQLRTAIATIFLLYVLLKREKNKGFFLLQTFFSMLFHYGGAIILFFNIERRLKLLLVGLILAVIISFNLDFILKFLDSMNPALRLRLFMSTHNEYQTANIFSSVHITQFFIVILGLISWKTLSQNQKKGLFLIFIGSFIYILLYYNPAIAHRIREISLLGVIPLLFADKIRWSYSFFLIVIGVLYIASYSSYWNIVRLITHQQL